jgi:hypothetical protein
MHRAGSLAVTVWLAAAMTAAPVSAASTTYRADLTAEEEVPMPGPPGGKGTAEVVVDHGGQLCYTLTHSGIGKPTAAHIHRGVKGQAGPVAVDFDYSKNGDKGCVPVDPAKLHELSAKPGDHYVNVHTPEHPNGAIRGQLKPA